MALGSLLFAAQGCGSSDDGVSNDQAGDPRVDQPTTVRWAASASSTSELAVTEWVLRGNVRHSELVGLHPGPERGQFYVFTHTVIEFDDDGTFRIAIDAPMKWSLERKPRESPTVSGPLTPSVSLVLTSGVLDQLGRPASASVSEDTTTSRAIAPVVKLQDGLLGDGGLEGGLIVGEGGAPLVCPGLSPLLKYRTDGGIADGSYDDDPVLRDRPPIVIASVLAMDLVDRYASTLAKDPICNVDVNLGNVRQCRDKYFADCESYQASYQAAGALDYVRGLNEKAKANGGAGLGKCELVTSEPDWCATAESCAMMSGAFKPYKNLEPAKAEQALFLCVGQKLFL